MSKKQLICEMEVTLNAIGGKYKALILEQLIHSGSKRFNELQRYMDGISQKTLTHQLRDLENEKLITRTVYPEVPPKVEYSITPKGESLKEILDLMCEWGYQHLDENLYTLSNPQCDRK